MNSTLEDFSQFSEPGEDDWFKNVTKFHPASTTVAEYASGVEFCLKTFLTRGRSSSVSSDSEGSCTAGRGFHDTDIVLIEAKYGKNAFLGSGVLLQNPSTWGKVDKSARRFIVTAGHCVSKVQYGELNKYEHIRLRLPIKPWKNFPEDCEKYCPGAGEMKPFYSNIMCGPEHIFVHPEYKGNWDFYDIALIAIPEVTPSKNAAKFQLWKVGTPFTSVSVAGFPLATEQNKVCSHIPYVSTRVCAHHENMKVEFKNNATMMRYCCRTFNGMSGGSVLFENNIIGMHTAGDAQYPGERGNGILFTEELRAWMQKSYFKWEEFGLGEHQMDNGMGKMLRAACISKNLCRVKELLSQGANPSWRDEEGNTPVWLLINSYHPCEQGHVSLFESTSGWLARSNFSRGEGHACLLALIENDADVNTPPKKGGLTPLQAAVKIGNMKYLQFLVQAKADVNAPNMYGNTPAIIAAWNGKKDCLKYLLDMKADLKTTNNSGESAVMHAAGAIYGGIYCLKLLEHMNADLNKACQMGRTPSYYAALLGTTDCLQFLGEMKADLMSVDQFGNSPVIAAAANGNLECLKLLGEMKADLAISNLQEQTAAYHASKFGRTECLKFLANEGVNLTDSKTSIRDASSACVEFLENYIDSFSVGEEIFFKSKAEEEYEVGYVGSVRPLKIYQKGWIFNHYQNYVIKKESNI